MLSIEMLTIQEVARRTRSSERHIHRILSTHDHAVTGRTVLGRRKVLIDWVVFAKSWREGRLRS